MTTTSLEAQWSFHEELWWIPLRRNKQTNKRLNCYAVFWSTRMNSISIVVRFEVFRPNDLGNKMVAMCLSQTPAFGSSCRILQEQYHTVFSMVYGMVWYGMIHTRSPIWLHLPPKKKRRTTTPNTATRTDDRSAVSLLSLSLY